ncbi:adhesion G protein-coupled receptor B2-like [Dermacentor albipictus]|uniref:adhesion G protein-coupled receptor B2-like n=1 Tax=Dermacentor albipictus TaxID=60249 RepID=UPI0038FCF5A7
MAPKKFSSLTEEQLSLQSSPKLAGYPDVVAQVCCEVSIMAAYTCVLVTTTAEPQLSEKQCLAASVCLQFFFLSVFLFLLIESAYVCRLLSPSVVPEYVPFNGASVSLAGFGFPAIVTGASAGSLGDKYTRQGQICWLDLSEGVSYATTVPVCVCVLLQLFFLSAAFCCSRPRRNLSPGHSQRARTQLSTRWASLLVLASSVLSWASGVAAEHQRSRGLYVCFSVSTIMLGVFIATLRITTEDQVRWRLLTKVGLSNAVANVSSPPCSSVRTWSRETLSSTNSSPNNSPMSTSATPEASAHRLKVFNPAFK